MESGQKEFSIVLSSDLSYEKLVAEIYFNGKFVALVSQEQGIDHPMIEFACETDDRNLVERKVPFDGFVEVLDAAVYRLKGAKI